MRRSSVHGLMHMVIANAHAGDPYPIDVLFLYMANMAWNSSMNTAGVIKMLEDKDAATGEYRIPKIIYSDAYASEMVAYADLVLPDTTYLERHDCISLLDRPISEPDAVQDAIRWPVVEPDRDVRGFQSVLIDLGARLKLPAFVDHRGKAIYKDYADYIVRHERRPGIGPLAGFRGAERRPHRARRGQSRPAQALHRKRLVLLRAYPAGSAVLQARQQGLSGFRRAHGLLRPAAAGDVPALSGDRCRNSACRPKACASRSRRKRTASASSTAFDPLPDWYRPFEEALVDRGDYPLSRHHPAAGGDVPFLGFDERLAAANPHAATRSTCPARSATRMGCRMATGSWLISHHGRIKVEIARTEAVNRDTIWTWNAIGKREGAWALDRDVPEAKRGFLMNHLINELLPPKGDGMRWSNSDPVTGQAAWYDLRVRIEKAEPGEVERAAVCRRYEPGGKPRARPDELRYGQEWAK